MQPISRKFWLWISSILPAQRCRGSGTHGPPCSDLRCVSPGSPRFWRAALSCLLLTSCAHPRPRDPVSLPVTRRQAAGAFLWKALWCGDSLQIPRKARTVRSLGCRPCCTRQETFVSSSEGSVCLQGKQGLCLERGRRTEDEGGTHSLVWVARDLTLQGSCVFEEREDSVSGGACGHLRRPSGPGEERQLHLCLSVPAPGSAWPVLGPGGQSLWCLTSACSTAACPRGE